MSRRGSAVFFPCASAQWRFRLLGTGRGVSRCQPRRKMAVVSNRPAAQLAAAARPASLEHPAEVPEFNKEQELAAYRQMLLIRRFEEKAGQLYGMGLIGGF